MTIFAIYASTIVYVEILDSPVTVKMRIRHYFGNTGTNPSGDRQRQSQEVTSFGKDNDQSPIPSTLDDNLKVLKTTLHCLF